MRLKVGDRVNFLNEKGGGVIKAIISSKMVKLETDDGFEMPVLSADLILDYRSEGQESSATSVPSTGISHPAVEEEDEQRITGINPWGTIKEEKGIYLAFEPHERQWVLTGKLDVVLINHTSCDILYNLYLEQEGELRGIDFSSVPFESKIVIETIERDELENWVKGFIQIMFHKDQPVKVYFPVHSVLDIKPSRFFKEGSYQSSKLIQGKSVLVSIAPESTFEVASYNETERKTDRQGEAKLADPLRAKQLIDKHRTAAGEAIIDLHIGEIIDNIAGLSSQDMFAMQLDYLRRTLENALKNDYQKVTFIHGVGNGVLKNAIIEELKKYEHLEGKMASISKFGVGAIDVLIKNNED